MIEIVYWNVRGRSNPIITICEYLKIEYKIKRVKDYNEWDKLKLENFKKGNHFINLPHIIDGEKTISETGAIINYIIQKFGEGKLLPDPEDNTKILELQGVFTDILEKFLIIFFQYSEIEKVKQEYKSLMESVKNKFIGLNFIIENNDWLSGKKLTYLDFISAEILEILLTFEKENNLNIVSSYQKFSSFLEKFINIEEVKNYRNSDRFLKRPFIAPFFVWK